ncbi:nucleoside phosphorylase domain-containing protein [Pelagophyceae sp. CCMP2097]|nr:nucleoside phosphorylase domain-containing protein [Pelagophyceae sp. CCMP2097]|eukprot:CAMPEP_0184086566 /NCGR_PEP_ID=MMETSP0974-20121125/5278_1 /TAXON_ID=483370 /ORGANISM="non described non described, Strain CCMP2097" /LENGTH=243 /DNA_ID=CAMNT_0026389257 /DNA_START=27 /DNA_END=758 /DNA_ORIENTATION=-
MASIRKVLIFVAMEEEAAPLIASLGLVKSATGIVGAPTVLHEGLCGAAHVSVVCPGRDAASGVNLVGTQFATLTVFLAAKQLLPDLIINAGTSGGFKRAGGSVGDIYSVTAFQYHDRRIPIPGYTEYGICANETHPTPLLVAALGLKSGICSTGDSLDCVPSDADAMTASNAACKDMEGAAVASIAKLVGVPFVAIKVITDIVDGEHATQDEFLRNLATASAALQGVVPKVVAFVAGKTLANL